MKKEKKKEEPKAMVFGDFKFLIKAKEFPGFSIFLRKNLNKLPVRINKQKRIVSVKNACLFYARGHFQISLGAYDNDHTFCFPDDYVKMINDKKPEKVVSYFDGFIYAGISKKAIERHARKIGIWKKAE